MNLKIRFADQVVGLFLLIAVLGLAAALILIGSNQSWFSKSYEFHSKFRSGGGLSVGLPITLRGFEIGKVRGTSLDPATRVVTMQFHIYDTYYEYVVSENSVLELASSPIGLGTSLLFHPGKAQTPPKPPLEEGSFIPSMDFKEGQDLVRQGLAERSASQDTIGTLLTQVGPIVEKVNEILYSLEETLLIVESGLRGDRGNQIGSLLYSTDSLIVSLNDVLEGRGDGPIGEILDNVNSTTATLDTSVNDILGTVGSVTDSLQKTVDVTTRELSTLLDGLKGVASRVDQMAANMETMTANLADLTADPTGLVTKLLAPKGSIQTLLDDDNQLYNQVGQMLAKVDLIIAELATFAQFVTGTTPQLTGLLEEGRAALEQGQDVLVALKNNPLLRGGVPEKKDQPTTFNSLRDEEF